MAQCLDFCRGQYARAHCQRCKCRSCDFCPRPPPPAASPPPPASSPPPLADASAVSADLALLGLGGAVASAALPNVTYAELPSQSTLTEGAFPATGGSLVAAESTPLSTAPAAGEVLAQTPPVSDSFAATPLSALPYGDQGQGADPAAILGTEIAFT